MILCHRPAKLRKMMLYCPGDVVFAVSNFYEFDLGEIKLSLHSIFYFESNQRQNTNLFTATTF
jgi:hypothetical protein